MRQMRSMSYARFTSLALVALLPACGAKSGLEVTDAGTDAFAFDAPVDAFMPDAAPDCRVDSDCDDRLDCTDNRCVSGSCVFTAVAARCNDGLFCNGIEYCDLTAGCLSPGRLCDDTVMCTTDVCDEARDRCVATPVDALCPVSFRCDGDRGCLARALVHDSLNLYEVDLPGGEERLLGRLPVSLTDIALSPDGTVYGADGNNLVRVDIETMRFEVIFRVGTAFNGLDTAPDGTLYGAAGSGVFRFDLVRGTSTRVSSFPEGTSSSGDLAFIGSRLLATARRSGTVDDLLVEIEPSGGPASIIGPIPGFINVWGLAPRGDQLFGFGAAGEVLRIDVNTARGDLIVDRTTHGFWGAASR